MTIKGRLLRTVVYAGGAAAATWFLDPEQGQARRERARDQLGARLGRVQRAVPSGPPADDRALTDRIRSELGDRFPDGTAELTVVDGTVELRGQVGDEAAKALVAAEVKKVSGVQRVVNLLHTPDQPAPNKAEAEQASHAAAAANNPSQ